MDSLIPTPLLVLAQTTLWVDELRGATGGHGSGERPLRTIALAMERAKEGDLIRVRSGLYPETLRFKAGVRICRDATSGRPTVRGRVRMADRTRLEDVDVSPDVSPAAVYGGGSGWGGRFLASRIAGKGWMLLTFCWEQDKPYPNLRQVLGTESFVVLAVGYQKPTTLVTRW